MKSKLVPQIRFPTQNTDWEKYHLSDLMEFSNGINAPKESYGKGRKMISVMDILDEGPIIYENIRNAVEVDVNIESKNKIENGDLVLVRSSEVRNEVGWAKSYMQKDFALYSGFTIRGKKKNEFNSKFVELCLNYHNRNQIESKAGGSTRYNVSQSILKGVEIMMPSLEEQNIVASFFNNIESLINLYNKEIKILEQTKQGFLQKMLPKEGDNVPEVRFPGFTEDWKSCMLRDLAEFSKGGGYSKGDLTPEGKPIILYGRLYTKYEFVIESVDTYTTEKEKSVISEGNEVIVPSSGESAEDIARASAVIQPGIILGGDLNIIKPIKEVDSMFLALAISNGNQQKQLIRRAQGKSVVHLNNSELKKVNLLYPNIQEQIKIRNFFKQLDEVILLNQTELNSLKKMKKAFLQKLFI